MMLVYINVGYVNQYQPSTFALCSFIFQGSGSSADWWFGVLGTVPHVTFSWGPHGNGRSTFRILLYLLGMVIFTPDML